MKSPVVSPQPIARVSATPTRDEATPDVIPNVWLVDQTHDFETYSNGLRIDDRYVDAQSEAHLLPGLSARGRRPISMPASPSGGPNQPASCITPPKAIRRALRRTKTPG